MSIVIAYGAGHYLGTEGRRCLKKFDPNCTQEWVLNSRVADEVGKQLTLYDCTALRIDDPTGKSYISVSDRAKKVNAAGSSVYISVHHNAGINGGNGGGIVVYTDRTPTDADKVLQNAIYYNLIKETNLAGNRANPKVRKNFTELVKSNCPALLLECGFMDSSTDVPAILSEEHPIQCATAIVDELVEYFSLKKKEEDTTDYTLSVPFKFTNNSNAKLYIYCDTKLSSKIGYLDPKETASCLGVKDDLAVVLYNTSSAQKIGFCSRTLGTITK